MGAQEELWRRERTGHTKYTHAHTQSVSKKTRFTCANLTIFPNNLEHDKDSRADAK